MIKALKENEGKLINQCEEMLNDLNSSLHPNKYEQNVLVSKIDSKEKIEKNELKENGLTSLNKKLSEIKKQLFKLSNEVKIFEDNYKFISNKISNANFEIDEIKLEKVIIIKQCSLLLCL